jgi:hypothetical protein
VSLPAARQPEGQHIDGPVDKATLDQGRQLAPNPRAWRGLYAVDLRIRTRDAVAAALAGTKAASAALGHASTEMRERHYLR